MLLNIRYAHTGQTINPSRLIPRAPIISFSNKPLTNINITLIKNMTNGAHHVTLMP